MENIRLLNIIIISFNCIYYLINDSLRHWLLAPYCWNANIIKIYIHMHIYICIYNLSLSDPGAPTT